jgi:hypothetical protein
MYAIPLVGLIAAATFLSGFSLAPLLIATPVEAVTPAGHGGGAADGQGGGQVSIDRHVQTANQQSSESQQSSEMQESTQEDEQQATQEGGGEEAAEK